MQGCSRFMANGLLGPKRLGVGAWTQGSIGVWSSCGGALPFRTGVKVTPGHGRLSHFWGHWSSTRVRCRTVSLIRGRRSVMRSKKRLALSTPLPANTRSTTLTCRSCSGRRGSDHRFLRQTNRSSLHGRLRPPLFICQSNANPFALARWLASASYRRIGQHFARCHPKVRALPSV
jgi:hypothetical protein